MGSHGSYASVAIFVLSLLAGGPRPAAAQVPPDTGLVDRQNAVLAELATRYQEMRVYPEERASCFAFGASTLGLVASLELTARGLPGGMTVAEADDDIAHLADEAVKLAGSASSACVWENAGSPGTMHGLLGLGMLLHRYRDRLSAATVQKIEAAAAGWWRGEIGPYLVNGNLSIVAGWLLAGEAMGYDSAVWQKGRAELEEIYEYTVVHGGLELNAPIYTAYQFAALVPLTELRDDELRGKARILLDYLFLVHAHLWLPGGGLGAPQARDYAGGALDALPTSLHRIAGLYAGGPTFAAVDNVHLIGAATDYALPEPIRSLYLDKGEGYTFHAYTPAPVKSRTGRGYDFVEGGAPIAPWEVVVVPDAMFGVNHAFRYQAIHVSMGAQAKAPDGTFPFLYQYQPFVEGDTSETLGGLPTSSGDTEPGDFVRELYDFRRLVHHRTLISLWDPTLAYKPEGSVRTYPETRVHVPDWAAHGGQMRTADTGGWMVGRLGDSYLAYLPLGTPAEGPERRSTIPGPTGDGTRDTEHFYLRLPGRSGGIVELATTDDFATLDDYVADLRQRHVVFSPGEPYFAEFDALVPGTGAYERVRLEYAPERRFVAGRELTLAEALDHGWLDSPFVAHDAAAGTLTVARGCLPRTLYDLSTGSITEEPAVPPHCMTAVDGTVFSDVPWYGDLASWVAARPERWQVVDDEGGERRLFLAPYAFVKDEDRLGEVALIDGRTFGDFRLTLRAKTHERIADNAAADYAVVFGHQDDSNYYILLANARADYSELFRLENGVRTRLALADTALIPDEGWHDLQVVREGEAITVSLDGLAVLTAVDDTYGEGAVGLGSLNDSALFDDVAVVVEEPPVDGGTPGEDGGVQDGGPGQDDGGAGVDAGPDDGGGSQDGGSGPDGGAPFVDGGTPDGGIDARVQMGCGCAVGGAGEGPAGAAWWLGLVGAAGVLRRRRAAR